MTKTINIDIEVRSTPPDGRAHGKVIVQIGDAIRKINPQDARKIAIGMILAAAHAEGEVDADNDVSVSRTEDGPHLVFCRDDTLPDGTPGYYIQATSRVFPNKDAAEHYMKSINPSRYPFIVALPVVPERTEG